MSSWNVDFCFNRHFVICNKCGVYMANDDHELFDVRETKGNVIEIAQGNTEMPSRQRTKIGGLTSGEKRVVYMSQLIDALPKPLPKELLLPVKHMQEMVRHYNGHAAAIQRLNEKIESQRKRLAQFEAEREIGG